MSPKILILAPQLNLTGGVANFYRMLKPFFSGEVAFLLKNHPETALFKMVSAAFFAVRVFCYLLFHPGISTVLLNPSLGANAVRRDMFLAFLATRFFHRNLAIFWHGWDLKYEKTVEQSLLPSFRRTFFKASKMFVLSSLFQKKLWEWGYQGKVVLTATCFDDCLLEHISRHPTVKRQVNLLFLSRVEKAKGIFIVLDTLALLGKRSPDICYNLCVAGSGNALPEAREYAKKLQLQNVEFTGYIRNNAKYEAFSRADIFFFPSYYSEGMPCAMLEAMGAGLYVCTRAVGGIPDIFKQPQMGYLTDSLAPEVFADAIEKIVQEHPDFNFYCEYNHNYAKKNFTASKTADFLMQELSSL